MMNERRVSRTAGVRVKVVVWLVVAGAIALGAWLYWRLPGPHAAMLGHWEKIRTEMPVENPGYRGTVSALTGRDIYISRERYWRVTATETVELRYRVSKVDTDKFSLTQAIVNPDGEEIYFDVTFSEDRQEMYVRAPFMTRGGKETLTAVYKKVGDETRP